MPFDTTSLTCPNCKTPIPLNSALTAQIRTELEKDFSQKQKAETAKLAQLQHDIQQQKTQFAQQQASWQAQQDELLKKEKEKIWAIAKQEALKKASEASSAKFKELEEENAQKTQALKIAEEAELAARKKAREVEERAQKLELEIQRKLDAERQGIVESTKKAVDEEHRLKFLEKEKQLAMMRDQIELLRRKSEQGSMQIQGEVQEDDLKQVLQRQFPSDLISDVEKGMRGADLVQMVRDQFGRECGAILWESKNTKEWHDDWIAKLKDDQGRVKAEVCVLVTQALPRGVQNFTQIQQVWVIKNQFVLLLTQAIRAQLIQLTAVQRSQVGREEKMEVLYQYLSGAQFKNRVENIVTTFAGMKDDLDKEKRAFERIWKKREQEIERVMNSTAGMYGDLQGLLGHELPAVASLELPLFEDLS